MSILSQPDEDVEMTNKKLLKGEKLSIKDVSSTQKGLRKQVIDGGCILLNIASTVTLVFLNKWYVFEVAESSGLLLTVVLFRIFKDPQLKKMQISFAMWHFTCTSIVLWIASRSPFNLFVPTRLPLAQMIPLCSFFAGFLILGNLSLAYNSIGFYQYVSITTNQLYRESKIS